MPTKKSTIDRTIRAYTSQAELYLKEWHRRTYHIPPHLKEWMAHLPPHSRILDLGCGPGQDSRYLRRNGFRVIGLDLTWPFLHKARKRSPTLPLIQAKIEGLPFSFQTFEGLWAAASLIHIPKTRFVTLLRQLHEVTKPGGLLGATMAHGKRSGFLADQWIRGRFLAKWHKQDLKRIVMRAGWEVVYLKTVVNQERHGRWLNLLARRREE